MNMIKSKYKITLVALAFFFTAAVTTTAFAQVKTYNEEITVVAPFDPIIPDAFKISQNPAIDDTTTVVPVMNYTILPRLADVRPSIEPLPAVKLVAEPLSKLYRNYIRAGGGNNVTLYGELFISSLRSKQYLTSLRLKHLSAAGTIKDYGPPGNSRDDAEITGTKYFNTHTISAKGFYYRDGLHLYGYKPADYPDTAISKDDIKQRYYTAGTSLSYGSNYKDKDKLNHVVNLSYYYMAGLYSASENNVQFSATLDKRYDLFKIEDDQILGITAAYSFLNQHDSLGHINSGLILIDPFIKAKYKEYSFMAGLKFNLGYDSTTKVRVYPELEARLELVPDALKLYAGFTGGMERTSLQSITKENLFISSIVPWNWVYEKGKVYLGFQSNISRNFNLNGDISRASFENYPFFVTDTSAYLQNSFSLIYDDISVVVIKGEFEFVKSTRFQLGLNAAYNHYKTTNQEYAWYKPAYIIGFTGRYNLQNKIVVTANATINGAVWALAPTSDPLFDGIGPAPYILTPEKLKGWADISLGTEYRFNRALAFWLNLNNLANSKYYSWYNYRSYGINIMGGVSYSF